MITISIVSHDQANLVERLLEDLQKCMLATRIVITQNLPSNQIQEPETISAKIVRISNPSPLGFGANHNAAFLQCDTPYFCILNPDVRFPCDPFPQLLQSLESEGVSLVGPLVRDPAGAIEDSARPFPTPIDILRKVIGLSARRYRNIPTSGCMEVDWIAGMFMLVRASDFRAVGGFDERYFLYYEDVDLCARLHKSDKRVFLCTNVAIVHDARRTSHRNLIYMKWHLQSMLRYFWNHYFGRNYYLSRSKG